MTIPDPDGERSSALTERLAEVLWRSAGDDTSVGNDEPMAWSEEHPYCRDSYRESACAALREIAADVEERARRNRLISASDVAAHLLGEALRG